MLTSNLAEIGMTVQDLEARSLSDIIKTNADMQCIQDNVFFATCTSLTTAVLHIEYKRSAIHHARLHVS